MRCGLVGLLWCSLVLSTGIVRGADPYESVGFVPIPEDVKLDAVSSVAIDSVGRLYVLHRGTPPLLQYDADGKFVRGWGTGLFKVPHGLRVDKDDHIWTTDNGNHVLRKFSPEGTLLATIGQEGKAAGGADGFRAPDDLVFDSRGRIYVADSGNGRIVQLDADGKYLSQWGKKGKNDGEFATAHGLGIDAADRIYVADRGNQRVQVFDTTGQHLASWGGFGNPFGVLAVGEELLATEGDKHFIVHLNREGMITAKWGTPETLKLPHLMAVNAQGDLFVSEVNGQRVQRFRRVKEKTVGIDASK